MNYLALAYKTFCALYLKKIPLIVTWLITEKCQSQCIYCDYWQKKTERELTFEEIESILNELKIAGTKFIHFTGGEPLLRKDLAKIFAVCSKYKFIVSLNSNCLLLPERFKDIQKYIQVLKVSLDGPRHIHNKIRGVSSFDKVIQTVEMAKKAKVKVTATTVLNTYNYQYLTEIIKLARNINLPLSFQFASPYKFKSNLKNNFSLNKNQRQQVVEQLIAVKKSSLAKYIYNSLPALQYMRDPQPWNCFMQRISIKIDSVGNLDLCGVKPFEKEKYNCRNKGFINTYKKIPYQLECSYPCWCAARIETNMLLSLNPKTMLSHWSLLSNL